METTEVAVIGGSGLTTIPGLEVVREIDVTTPFGAPSDTIQIWQVEGIQVAFLPRHARGHRHLPGEVPSLANIWALKSLGVRQIVAFSAVGSLQEEMRPGDFVLCDQLIDRTRSRPGSFFGQGVAGHVAFADPYCARMRDAFAGVLDKNLDRWHPDGTLVVMEGPAFSTRAESHLYRSWGAHLIGMTALPEAKLAREAEICLTLIAMVTDYDCWKVDEEEVTVQMVVETMEANSRAARTMLPDLVRACSPTPDCACHHAAEHAVMTAPALIPQQTRERLELLYGKYWGKS
jgi:5'-methylthioadenosine phosphorylase